MYGCQQNKKEFLGGVEVYIPDENRSLSEVINADVFNLKTDGFFDYGYFHTDVWLKFPIHIQSLRQPQDVQFEIESVLRPVRRVRPYCDRL